jgi:hypothetical protein
MPILSVTLLAGLSTVLGGLALLRADRSDPRLLEGGASVLR